MIPKVVIHLGSFGVVVRFGVPVSGWVHGPVRGICVRDLDGSRSDLEYLFPRSGLGFLGYRSNWGLGPTGDFTVHRRLRGLSRDF